MLSSSSSEIMTPNNVLVDKQHTPPPSSDGPEEQPQQAKRGPFHIRRELVPTTKLVQRDIAILTVLSVIEQLNFPTEVLQPTFFLSPSGIEDLTKDAASKAKMRSVYQRVRNAKQPTPVVVCSTKKGDIKWRVNVLTPEVLEEHNLDDIVELNEPELATYLLLVEHAYREENNTHASASETGRRKSKRSIKSKDNDEEEDEDDDDEEEDSDDDEEEEEEEDEESSHGDEEDESESVSSNFLPQRRTRKRQEKEKAKEKIAITVTKKKRQAKNEPIEPIETPINSFENVITSLRKYHATQNATFVDQHKLYSSQIDRIETGHKRKREEDQEKLADELRRRDERIQKVSREFEKRMVELNGRWEAHFNAQNARIIQLELEKSLQEEKSKELSSHVARLETRIEELFKELSGVIQTRQGECMNAVQVVAKREEDLRTAVQNFQRILQDQMHILQLVAQRR